MARWWSIVLLTLTGKSHTWNARTPSCGPMDLLIAPSLHAVDSVVLSRGRPARQALFGKAPRLPGGLMHSQDRFGGNGGEGAFGGCEGDSRSERATVHRYPSNPRFGARESMLEMETAKTEKEGWLGDSQVPFLGPRPRPNWHGRGQEQLQLWWRPNSFVLPLASNSGCLASRT